MVQKAKIFFVLSVCVFLIDCQSNRLQADLIIESTQIVDLESGKILNGQNIVISGDTIMAVSSDPVQSEYRAKEIINGSNFYILPGFWDMHVHFGGGEELIEENKNLLPLYIAHGITTVRDCAADLTPSLLQWRDDIAKGNLLGPTIFMSGPKIEGINSVWAGDIEVGTVQELQEAFDSLASLNVDFIKVTDNTLTPELFLETIKESRDRDYPVTGHIPFALTMTEVVDAGLSAVEHLTYAVKAGCPQEKQIIEDVLAGHIDRQTAQRSFFQNFDPNYASRIYQKMATHKMSIVPTLTLSHNLANFDRFNRWQDQYLKYIGPGLQKTYENRLQRLNIEDSLEMEERRADYQLTISTLPLLRKAGVKIITGTDAGYLNSFVYPGIGLHEEMQLMVESGLSVLDVLRSTIKEGPAFLNKKGYGAIKKNYHADLVLLNKNPLNNIQNTRAISGVIVKGKYFKRQDLDELLENTAAKYLADER